MDHRHLGDVLCWTVEHLHDATEWVTLQESLNLSKMLQLSLSQWWDPSGPSELKTFMPPVNVLALWRAMLTAELL